MPPIQQTSLPRTLVGILFLNILILLPRFSEIDEPSGEHGEQRATASKVPYLTLDGRRSLQGLLHQTLDSAVSVHLEGQEEAGVEGNSAQVPKESEHYLQLAMEHQPVVVCEIGFNAGHSAATFLAGSDSSVYQGFDLWQHSYNQDCLEVVQRYFGERVLGVVEGDSTETVPAFVHQNPGFRCDLIHVDGGHFGDVPLQDLNNMRALAHENTLVIMDDLACKFGRLVEGNGCRDPMDAWFELKQQGLLQELGCHSYGQIRGMCWGKYLQLNETSGNGLTR